MSDCSGNRSLQEDQDRICITVALERWSTFRGQPQRADAEVFSLTGSTIQAQMLECSDIQMPLKVYLIPVPVTHLVMCFVNMVLL